MPSNEHRIEMARRAVLAHDTELDGFEDLYDEPVIDLLTDLMHLCEDEGIDWESAFRMAEMHYEEEK